MEKKKHSWLAGEDVCFTTTFDQPVVLRVKGDRVQTSQGAEISVKMALRLWDRIKARQSVQGFDFGPYKADGIQDDVLTVGCHKVLLHEIKRIAVSLGG